MHLKVVLKYRIGQIAVIIQIIFSNTYIECLLVIILKTSAKKKNK